MGLSSFDGVKYYLAEETKLAMAGVETLPPPSSIQQNPVKDVRPAPVDAQVQPMQQAPVQPAVNKPPAPAPQASPEPPQNVYSGGLSSLPSMTRKYPNMETKMSKLRSLLDKTAMTEEDLYGSYSDDNSAYSELPEYEYQHPAMQARAGMENYTPEANYSDYMAYVPEYSREPTELEAQDIYDDYSPEQSMGYDPYQAYSNYEQMYATPGEVQGEVEDIQVPQVSPEVQEYEAQRKVYEESYTQIVNYLMQMGYSAEEAQAAAPSLLGQVSVQAPTAPEGYGQSKAASYVFKTAEEKLTSRYISQGYSPQQARQLALEYVIPESEKYASQARLIGAGVGGLGGAIGGSLAYDDEGEIGGALAGTALGALTGALAPGLPARLRNRYVGKDLLAAARADTRKSKSLGDIRDKILNKKDVEPGEVLRARGMTGREFEDAAAFEAAANRSGDAQKLLALGVPAYIAHRYMANSGGDNLADRSFDLLSDAGDLAYLAGQKGVDLAKENKGALLAGGAGIGALAAGSSLANALAKRKAAAKPAKKKKVNKSESTKEAGLQALRDFNRRVADYVLDAGPLNYRPLLGAAGGASLLDFSSSDPDTLGSAAAKVIIGAGLGHVALKPHARGFLVDRVIKPVATATWNKGTQAGRAVTDFIKKNPEITIGAGGGAYLGAEQFEDFNEFLHEPVQIGDTKVYLKKPTAAQKANLMLSGALAGGAAGAVGGALLKPLIRGVPSAIASGANRAVDSVRSAASGSEKLLAPTAIGAASGALTDGYIEATKEDGDVLRGLGRGAAFGGAQGALAGLLTPAYAKTLAGVAYPATVAGQQALNSYLGKPTVIETTLQTPEKDQGILDNAYVKGGLGALGTAGALYGASKLLDGSGPKKKKPTPKNRAKRKAKK